MWADAQNTLSGTSDELVAPIPREGNNYVAVVRLTGFGTATAKVQTGSPSGGYSDETVRDANAGGTGNPSSNGVYTADLTDGANFLKVILSSHTSGDIRAEVAFVPDVS